ncbi:MAG: bifunctional helix-turn-helix domain-containing protein/methylated-DNA--[protein]-cysteine S-methyltransferase [Gammaproteobacteria bacterium]|nr:bifunctional helix-turn-helix domain-containing protein/methylated-DNA--[protein]-cysteine S-methyltransferase [Gammaproteobacteria bacterium]MBV9695699.1 bifunctional helix-turn-helix domain-containing protein/methylated-DNA--[protein]-cysteine S-methyltransferase [Gammaproteobacteria bacterium]
MNARHVFLDSRDFARIARAIRYIEANYRAQPRLAAIAAAAHLSEFHFNRLFRRWAGITPRQYLAFVTARAARGALHATPSVLEAAYAVGLSGPGRLHDLLVTLEAVTPGELKSAGAGIRLCAGFSDTPFGRALFASTPRGLAHLSFVEMGEEGQALAQLQDAWPRAPIGRDDAAAATLARRIWGGEGGTLTLAVRGTNFQLKVWQALLELAGPTTYGELGKRTGMPAAVRAIGSACRANPVAWLIPCHNVLRSDGELSGYHWGADRKRAILAWEAIARTAAQAPVARSA